MSGDLKLVMQLVIEDEPFKGRVIFGHVSLGEYWRAKQLVQSLKKALGFLLDAPLPDHNQMRGLKLRVLITAWNRPDGQVCESVSEFDAEIVPF